MLDSYDIKVLREEGEDTRNVLELLRKDIKETNRLLLKISSELIKINVNTQDKPYGIGPR